MAESMNKIMINTIVKKAIRNIKTDPDRTIRNLVDMALNFAGSRFQKHFYSAARNLLANEDSGYYALVRDTLTKVNEDRLLTFCMNLGYNGLYQASGRIRELESRDGYNIPWIVSLRIAGGEGNAPRHHVIEQGEALGPHVWLLFSQHSVCECLKLASCHPNSAFIIVCDDGEINAAVLDYADNILNAAFVVPYGKDADAVCQMLSESGHIYGLYHTYTENDIDQIESGELMHDMEQLHPAIAILKPQYLFQQSIRDRVNRWITDARMEQTYRTILWELYGDTMLVDEVISDDPCWVGFDEYGQLCTENGICQESELNIFHQELSVILKQAFPKKKGTNEIDGDL